MRPKRTPLGTGKEYPFAFPQFDTEMSSSLEGSRARRRRLFDDLKGFLEALASYWHGQLLTNGLDEGVREFV